MKNTTKSSCFSELNVLSGSDLATGVVKSPQRIGNLSKTQQPAVLP